MSDDIGDEVVDLAGRLFVERVYDRVMTDIAAAKSGRSWFFSRIDRTSDPIVDTVAPDLVAATIMVLLDELKFDEIRAEGPRMTSVAVLADGRQVTPSEHADLGYECFGPDGLFAKYSTKRLPDVAEE